MIPRALWYLEKKTRLMEDLRPIFLLRKMPVSYTHLDVYKRQIYPLSFAEFYAAFDGDYDDAWEE